MFVFHRVKPGQHEISLSTTYIPPKKSPVNSNNSSSSFRRPPNRFRSRGKVGKPNLSQSPITKGRKKCFPLPRNVGKKKTLIFNNGSRYSGEIENGKPHGEGEKKYPNGGEYKGMWKSGKRDGDGIMKQPNGDKCFGSWKNGKLDGCGVIRYQSGGVYSGEFLNGKRHGGGTYIFPNGVEKYIGTFKLGKFDGHGVRYFARATYVGTFKDGKNHGRGIYIDCDQNEEKRDYVNGILKKTLAITCVGLPFYWGNNINKDDGLFNVSRTSEEFERVWDYFLLGTTCDLGFKRLKFAFEIVKVEQWRSLDNWTKFFNRREELSNNNDEIVNEIMMFHGCNEINLEDILQNGIDPRYSSSSSVYGQGAYFATDIRLSNYFVNPLNLNGERKVLLCRVLLGNVKEVRPNIDKVPPPNCHSYTSESLTEIVVFEKELSYPHYVITYKTNCLQGDWDPYGISNRKGLLRYSEPLSKTLM